MDKEKIIHAIIDLLKIPIIGLTAFLFLMWSISLDIDKLSLSSSGIEISSNKGKNTVEFLTRINALELEVKKSQAVLDYLKKQNNVDSNALNKIMFKITDTNFEQSQALDNSVLDFPDDSKGEKILPDYSNTVGYIWLGDWDVKSRNWDKIKIAGSINNYVDITKGDSYKVLGNMVIRESLPPNTAQYYNDVKPLGIVPKGEEVEILENPILISRPHKNQIWVKVQVQNYKSYYK